MEPKFFLSHEIVSALDVSVKVKILHLLKALNKEKGIGKLFISPDIFINK
jgi:ABC-type oligopeptide transport system ATPase subunit